MSIFKGPENIFWLQVTRFLVLNRHWLSGKTMAKRNLEIFPLLLACDSEKGSSVKLRPSYLRKLQNKLNSIFPPFWHRVCLKEAPFCESSFQSEHLTLGKEELCELMITNIIWNLLICTSTSSGFLGKKSILPFIGEW